MNIKMSVTEQQMDRLTEEWTDTLAEGWMGWLTEGRTDGFADLNMDQPEFIGHFLQTRGLLIKENLSIQRDKH